jgi:hypothetical protein
MSRRSQTYAYATTALKNGDAALLNAIYVAFLEQLDFRSDAGKEAMLLMPAGLKKGRYAVLDYDKSRPTPLRNDANGRP